MGCRTGLIRALSHRGKPVGRIVTNGQKGKAPLPVSCRPERGALLLPMRGEPAGKGAGQEGETIRPYQKKRLPEA